MLRVLLSRLFATCWPRASEDRLNEDIRDHLDYLTAEQISRGLSPQDASDAARREFGPVEAMKENYRDRARYRLIENLIRDVRFGARQMRKSPALTAAAVLSLALGIGANVALFSFVDALLLKRLAVPEARRLLLLKTAGQQAILSYNEISALNRDARQVDGVAGTYLAVASMILSDRPHWVPAELVTGEYFRVMQVQAARGRLLNQLSLDQAEADPVCVISYRYWQNQLGGDPNVVGRKVRLNTHLYRIAGVVENAFRGSNLQQPSDVYIPVTRVADFMPAFVGVSNFDWKSRLYFFPTFARLRPDVSEAGAGIELSRINRDFLKTDGRADRKADLQAVDGSAGLDSGSGLARPAAILLAVSSIVLLIACANLATLLLSRTSARSLEFAVRLAIGGSQRRVLAQVLVESSLLAVCGAVLGIGLAFGIEWMLLLFVNRNVPLVHRIQVTPDTSALVFTLALAAICVLLFGGSPALQAARTKMLGSSAGNTLAGTKLRKAFVVLQVALSFVVVFTAGLLTQSLKNLQTVDLGYHPDEVTAIEIKPATGGYSGTQADTFYKRVVTRLQQVPGVNSASTALGANLRHSGFQMKLNLGLPGNQQIDVNVYGVGPGYFSSLGGRIIAGRDFDTHDSVDKPHVYIINDHLARQYFRGINPVGRTLPHLGQIVGVVSDLRDQGLRNQNRNTVYQAASQLLTSGLTIFVHCNGRCNPLLDSMRKAIEEVDPNTPVFSMYTMQTGIEGALSSEQALSFISSLFAVLAILLTATGLYGVLSYMLARRTREIGLRVAIGASPRDIARLFAKDILALVGPGTMLGIPAAWAAVAFLRAQLFGVRPNDPQSAIAAALCVVTVAVLASIVPIGRAIRITPQEALKVD